MNKKEFQDEMLKYTREISTELSEMQLNQFFDYMNLLLEWNEKINLTAITKPEEIVLKHFIDSIIVANSIAHNSKIVDVGTGAGFPGIPLKIVRPDLQITLLDSLNKRINFLKDVIENLHLENIETAHARVEEYGKNKKVRETFDIATSRAVANMSVLAEYMLPLVKVNGKCILLKGSQIEEELQQSKKALTVLGGTVEKVDDFELPLTDIKRNVVYILKDKSTPAKYPRKPGTPSKEPIQ